MILDMIHDLTTLSIFQCSYSPLKMFPTPSRGSKFGFELLLLFSFSPYLLWDELCRSLYCKMVWLSKWVVWYLIKWNCTWLVRKMLVLSSSLFFCCFNKLLSVIWRSFCKAFPPTPTHLFLIKNRHLKKGSNGEWV